MTRRADRSFDGPMLVETFGYLVVGVPDLADAVDFYTSVGRLSLTEYREDTAFLSGGPEHHWLQLVVSDEPGVQRLGYKVRTDDDLAELRRRLDEAGFAVAAGDTLREDRVGNWLRCTDPVGLTVDLYTTMAQLPTPSPATGVEMCKLVHCGILAPDWDATLDFYIGILGFRASDWVTDNAVFLRCADGFHHSAALIRGRPADTGRVEHVCLEVGSIDDVMRLRHNAVAHGVALKDDLLRHAPSGAISVYVTDPKHGYAIEFATGHSRVADDHLPRTLTTGIAVGDIWRVPLPPVPALPEPRPRQPRLEP